MNKENFDQQRIAAGKKPIAHEEGLNSIISKSLRDEKSGNAENETVHVDNLNDVVDLSKIKNMAALEMKDADAAKIISNKAVASPHKAEKRKFCFMPAVEIPLPSHGRFYQDSNDEDLKNGIIKMYPMSVSDEEILTNSAYLKSGSAIRLLFESCMASDYEAGKLLSFDSTYLLYALRKISYGDDYNFKIKCPNCGKQFEYTLNVSEIPFEELPDDAKDIYDISLPVSKYSIEMTLPRLKQDENVIKIKKLHENISDTVASILSHTTSIKDPDGNEINPKDWADLIGSLPGSDRSVITKTFSFTKYTPKVNPVCPNCGNEFEESVPMDLDFFRLS